MSTRILVIHGSNYGHTARIADRIGRTLLDSSCSVTAISAKELAENLDLDAFDGVVIAASVIKGRHQKTIERFVSRNRLALNVLPGAFYSVSGAAASPIPEEAALADTYVSEFLAKTHWKPIRTFTLAGEIAYTRYDPITRFILRRICRKGGLSTDTSRDHDYTNWARVVSSAKAFAALVGQIQEADAVRVMNLEPAMAHALV